VFNCLIQFLLTMVLSIEERVFLVVSAERLSERTVLRNIILTGGTDKSKVGGKWLLQSWNDGEERKGGLGRQYETAGGHQSPHLYSFRVA
jgi:hypothetical protein